MRFGVAILLLALLGLPNPRSSITSDFIVKRDMIPQLLMDGLITYNKAVVPLESYEYSWNKEVTPF